jgi:hypothetical protein
MLRFLLILGLITYVVYKIGSFFFRAGAASQELKNMKEQNKRANAGPQKQKTKLKGGDYIDYEEIK